MNPDLVISGAPSRTGSIDLPGTGKSNPGIELRQIDPTGKSLLIFRNGVKPRNQKYFASLPTQISSLIRTVPSHQRGDRASSRARGGMRWTQKRQARIGSRRAR
jgi:hypothetical protein